jgi:hypothetical protein
MGYTPKEISYFAFHGLVPETLLKGWAKGAKNDPVECASELIGNREASSTVTVALAFILAVVSLVFFAGYHQGTLGFDEITAEVVVILATAGFSVVYMRGCRRDSKYSTGVGEFGHDLWMLGQATNQSLGQLMLRQSELRGDARKVLERLGSKFHEACEDAKADHTDKSLKVQSDKLWDELNSTFDLFLRFGLIDEPRKGVKPFVRKARPAPAQEIQQAA